MLCATGMLANLHISNFRSFRELHIPRLTRVNLFVGPNNAGKTSILEAAEIVARGTADALWLSLRRREEQAQDWTAIAHLFFGHDLIPESVLVLEDQGPPRQFVRCEVRQDGWKPSDTPDSLSFRFFTYRSNEPSTWLIASDKTPPAPNLFKIRERVSFLDAASLDLSALSTLWDFIVLTPEEAKVTEALRIIEPRIDRIAFSSAESGFFLRLQDSEHRVPIGSVGDGLKRIFRIALHLSISEDGLLLIDEIDTGLHHKAMADMWRMVIETARRLNVQVLATTHSLDCVHALAWVHETDPDLAADVTLHRVEKDLSQTVAYTAEELAVAARHHIEVR